MIWTTTLQIRRHVCSGHFNFIILFISILPLYAINLDDVNLLVDSSFTFAVILNDVLYQFELINIVLYLSITIIN